MTTKHLFTATRNTNHYRHVAACSRRTIPAVAAFLLTCATVEVTAHSACAQNNSGAPGVSAGAGNVVKIGGSNEARSLAFGAPSPSSDSLRLRDAAQSNYQASQFQTAIGLYRRIVQSPVADANDYYWLGESNFHAHQYAEAAQAFNRAVALNPAADNVRVRLAETYLCAKQPELAKQVCQSAGTVVKDEYSKKQLNALMRVASLPSTPRKPKAPNANSRTGQLEQ